jgi:hypothetical protein
MFNRNCACFFYSTWPGYLYLRCFDFRHLGDLIRAGYACNSLCINGFYPIETLAPEWFTMAMWLYLFKTFKSVEDSETSIQNSD